jgi:hypothetical protein
MPHIFKLGLVNVPYFLSLFPLPLSPQAMYVCMYVYWLHALFTCFVQGVSRPLPNIELQLLIN